MILSAGIGLSIDAYTVRKQCREKMVTGRALTVSATKEFTKEHVAGHFEKHCRNEAREQIRRKGRVRALHEGLGTLIHLPLPMLQLRLQCHLTNMGE